MNVSRSGFEKRVKIGRKMFQKNLVKDLKLLWKRKKVKFHNWSITLRHQRNEIITALFDKLSKKILLTKNSGLVKCNKTQYMFD